MEVNILEGAGLSVENPNCNGAVELGETPLGDAFGQGDQWEIGSVK